MLCIIIIIKIPATTTTVVDTRLERQNVWTFCIVMRLTLVYARVPVVVIITGIMNWDQEIFLVLVAWRK